MRLIKTRYLAAQLVFCNVMCAIFHSAVGETGASCYRDWLLQGHVMQNYHIDGELGDSSCILIHQRNH